VQSLLLVLAAADGNQAPPPPSPPTQRQGLSPAGIKGLVAAIFIFLGLAGAAAAYVWYRRRNSRRDGFDSFGQTLGWSNFGQTFNWWGSGAPFRWGDVMPWSWGAAARQRKYQQQVSLRAVLCFRLEELLAGRLPSVLCYVCHHLCSCKYQQQASLHSLEFNCCCLQRHGHREQLMYASNTV
jgi:hypothetical protein